MIPSSRSSPVIVFEAEVVRPLTSHELYTVIETSESANHSYY